MGTGMSQIQALVTYANETDGESDVTIGEAVRHLAESYYGEVGDDTSQMSLDSAGPGTLQVKALIDYANSVTGKGDTTLGDAVETLVSGYAKIVFHDWLVTDGSCYIATDIYPVDSGMKMEFSFMVSNSSSIGTSSYVKVLGEGSSTTPGHSFGIHTISWKKKLIAIFGYASSGAIMSYSDDTEYKVVWEENSDTSTSVRITEGTSVTSGSTDATTFYSNEYSMYLFAKNNGNSADGYLPSGSKIGTVSLYQDGSLLHCLRPCSMNGVLGMYDTVTRKFYGNSGSGTLSAADS